MIQEKCNLLAGSPNICHLRWVEKAFDTEQVLNPLPVFFMVLECVGEKNFKIIYELKDWKRFH
jgi:hypothetical protein